MRGIEAGVGGQRKYVVCGNVYYLKQNANSFFFKLWMVCVEEVMYHVCIMYIRGDIL